MSEVVNLNCIATDYSPLGAIKIIKADGNWKTVLDRDDHFELWYGIMEEFIEKAIADDENITIMCRNKRDISLLASFTSCKKIRDRGDSFEDAKEAVNANKASDSSSDKKKKKDGFFSQKCLNGIVGALSGDVKIGDIQTKYIPDYLKAKDKDITFRINLQIKSRMDSEKHSFFLITLLMNGNLSSHARLVYNTNDNFFDFMLMDILAEKLRQAIPKGFYRKYRRYEKNDSRLTGSIDIARHIRLNMGQSNGKIAYSYRENTADNNFNRLILAAYKRLIIKYPDIADEKLNGDQEIYNFLKQLQVCTENERVSVQKLIADNLMPIAHPYYTEYEEVRQVCLKILRDEGVSIFDADSGRISGFLFYLPDLWEIYLYKLIKQAIEPISDCQCIEQKKNKFFEGNKNNEWKCDSIPDFLFHQGKDKDTVEHPFLILDAKFIPNWEKSVNSEYRKGSLASVCGNDINKCLRDMVALNINSVGIIYPRYPRVTNENNGNIEIKKDRKISMNSDKNIFYIQPMEIPDANEDYANYSDWKAVYEISEQKFIESIRTLCIQSIADQKKSKKKFVVKRKFVSNDTVNSLEKC